EQVREQRRRDREVEGAVRERKGEALRRDRPVGVVEARADVGVTEPEPCRIEAEAADAPVRVGADDVEAVVGAPRPDAARQGPGTAAEAAADVEDPILRRETREALEERDRQLALLDPVSGPDAAEERLRRNRARRSGRAVHGPSAGGSRGRTR